MITLRDIWSDGTTMWVTALTLNDSKLYAYNRWRPRRATVSDKDFNTLSNAGNTDPLAGIWSDGTTMWVADVSPADEKYLRLQDVADQDP